MQNHDNHRVYKMSFASVYPHYVAKVEKKGRTTEELEKVLCWLTGYIGRGVRVRADKTTALLDFGESWSDVFA